MMKTMMKMSRRIACCCVALFLVLTTVSAAHRTLNSIKDLKEINFGQSVPRHSLLLLYWFANTVDIHNDILWLNFDPDNEDYGAHHYGNYEGLLDLPQGYRYYTIGNLNRDTSMQLPSYVLYPPRGYVGRNLDRIIIGVSGWGSRRRVDQVYITQHHGHWGTEYDPARTYQISTNLLREMRQVSVGQNTQIRYPINHFGSSAAEDRYSHALQSGRLENRLNDQGDCALWVCIILSVFVILILLMAFLSYKER